ncbi:sirohydrochlorin chelatase [Bacillota bacterium Lsc_1132]
MKAILFVGHGSKDHEGNDQVRQFIESMSIKWDDNIHVQTSFLEFENPTINQGIDVCVEKGADHIVVIPIMLLQAGHSKIHIPAAIDEAKKKYPFVQFTYGRPIGVHEETFVILKKRLTETGENLDHPDPDTAVLLLGRGGSDPDANSDLYKISRLLWEKTNYKIVEPAFMGVTSPLVNEGIERCIKLGAKKVIILPYFLFTGILIKRLEKMMVAFQKQYSAVEFILAGYFGYHPRLQTILIERVEEAFQGEVKMNCDTCQYRLDAMEHMHHHHHHDHHHDHHQHEHSRHHEQESQKAGEQR